MSAKIKLRFEDVRSLGFASIGAAYVAVGSKTANPARMILIQNFTDESLMFSFDGVSDHIPVKGDSSILLDLSSNKTIDDGFFLPAGETLYVKEITTPTSGSVYFSVFYGEDN